MPALLITAFLSTEADRQRSRVFRADCNKREELFASSPQLPSTPSFPFSFLVHSRQQSLAIRDRRSLGLTEGNRSRRRRRRDTGILLSTSWPGKIMAITSTTLLGEHRASFLSGGGAAWRGSQSEYRKNFRNELDFL